MNMRMEETRRVEEAVKRPGELAGFSDQLCLRNVENALRMACYKSPTDKQACKGNVVVQKILGF